MKKIITLLAFSFCFGKAYAQLNPLSAIYFQNEYLINPSLTGEDGRLNLNANVKSQWTNTPGAPIMQAISADYGFSEKVGAGFSVQNEKAGLLQRIKAGATFAFRLPLSEEQTLNFGLGASIFHESFDYNKLQGDQTDLSPTFYNNRPAQLDADFGVSYSGNGFKAQVAIPNTKRFLNRDILRNTVDNATFYSSLSFRNTTEYSMWFDYIEYKVAYRGVQGFPGIFDGGVNVNFLGGDLILNGMYHSTNSFTFGIGTIIKKSVQLIGYYTANTSKLQSFNASEIEIGIKYSIFGQRRYNSGLNRDNF